MKLKNSVVIPQSLELRSIVLGCILIYRNWSFKVTLHAKRTLILDSLSYKF